MEESAVAQAFQPYDIGDPFDFYARARREEPVFFSDELGYWVVTRHADMLAIFKDPATFSSENTQTPFKPRPPEVTKVFADAGMKTTSSGLSAIQPPDHTRLRGFIKKAFTPRRIATLEPDIRAMTTRMIDRFADEGRADLVADLVHELPALVIFKLVGVPDDDVPQIKEYAASRVLLNFGHTPTREQVRHAENLVAYWRYCMDLVESRFDEPTDDLTGALVRIYQDGDQSISKEEIAGLIHTQLFAGHETTTGLLGDGLKELLRDRGRWDELCASPSLIPGAVEEMLRLATPVFAWKRRTTTGARVGDVDLPAGSNLIMLLGSGNRDETVFDRPDCVDLHRDNSRSHLAFGHGIHFCLGAPLARLEAQVVVEELTRRLPDMRLVDQEFVYAENTTFRGPKHVLVEWEPDPLVVDLRDAAGDVARVGGKAASLGTCIAAGLPVPDGFAVTTTAFSAGMTDALRAAITRAYARMGDGDMPVAVRSSATAEDGADASFAGQQDTYLWVVGAPAVVDAVERCWASLQNERAVAYRADRGIEDSTMGVVVQRMVAAEAAGVAMTLDPANGDRTTVAIESSFGLGETVVGGEVTPDSFRVDKVMLEITSSAIADKHVELRPGNQGPTDVEPERRGAPSLSPQQVRAVAALAKQAERHYGCPQDIEWAVVGDDVVLLQSRPETVWSRKRAEQSVYKTGLAGIVDTLVNPLAARKEHG